MPMEVGPVSPTDRAAPPSMVGPTMIPMQNPMMISDEFARDAILAWYRGEFAAANAIIDALCGHLTLLAGGAPTEYEAVFSAIHRRRLNWIPVLQMQKYHSIADVAVELRRLSAKKKAEMSVESAEAERKKSDEVKVAKFDEKDLSVGEKEKIEEKVTESFGNGEGEVGEEHDSSPESDITDSGK
jgi:alkylated DNA repair protein alkB family protein 5